jgi:aminoglycoside 3-N-acetyltransferase
VLQYIHNKIISKKQKQRVKQNYYKINRIITDCLFQYDSKGLKKALERLGIEKGDTLLVHSSYNYFNGFKENPQDIIKCLLEILGEEGNLLMVSLPYRSSSYAYLLTRPVFDVIHTPSKMGIISEIFRRREGVLRSLHPTHPVTALGKDAAWIVEGHQACLFPCGKNTPFDKFRRLKGKVLFFDVPFSTFTFIHYIEDRIKDRLPFQVYSPEPMTGKIRDYDGKEFTVDTFVFSDFAVKNRDPHMLEKCLLRENMLKKAKIGKTKLMSVQAEDAIECAKKMVEKKVYFYKNING